MRDEREGDQRRAPRPLRRDEQDADAAGFLLKDTPRLATLTAREHEVALAVGAGRANADIARELHMSVATVKAHVSRLLAKLEVENRIQIALLVRDAANGR